MLQLNQCTKADAFSKCDQALDFVRVGASTFDHEHRGKLYVDMNIGCNYMWISSHCIEVHIYGSRDNSLQTISAFDQEIASPVDTLNTIS